MPSSHRSVQAAAPAPARVGRASTSVAVGPGDRGRHTDDGEGGDPDVADPSPAGRRGSRGRRQQNSSRTSVPMISATLSVVPNTLMAQSFTDDGTWSTTTSPTDTTGLSVPSIKALTSSATPRATAAASTPAHAARPLSVRRVDARLRRRLPGRSPPCLVELSLDGAHVGSGAGRAGHDRRPVRPSTSSIQPSGAGSSSGSEATPHSEQTAIDDRTVPAGRPRGRSARRLVRTW